MDFQRDWDSFRPFFMGKTEEAMFLAMEREDRSGGSTYIQARILLIVDDSEKVRTTLRRLLSSAFDEVFLSANPNEAEQLLGQHDISHILCDYDLGKDMPKGTELVIEWRRQYPEIGRAVILTGSDISQIDVPPEVDAIFSKTMSPRDLLAALE